MTLKGISHQTFVKATSGTERKTSGGSFFSKMAALGKALKTSKAHTNHPSQKVTVAQAPPPAPQTDVAFLCQEMDGFKNGGSVLYKMLLKQSHAVYTADQVKEGKKDQTTKEGYFFNPTKDHGEKVTLGQKLTVEEHINSRLLTLAGRLSDHPEIVKLMREGAVIDGKVQKLTFEEAAALMVYTSGAYKNINPELRSSDKAMTLPTELSEGLAKNAMRKLATLSQSASEEQRPLYRGVKMPEALLQTYKTALASQEPLTEEALLSTSLDQKVAFDFLQTTEKGKVPCMLLIKGKGGCDVSPFSEYGGEKEVCFPPGTQFKVTRERQLGSSKNGKSTILGFEVEIM